MRFVLFPLLNGECIGINVAEITVICVVKKGTRIFLKNELYYDVDMKIIEVFAALHKSISNFAE